jgi:hypothetical protein
VNDEIIDIEQISVTSNSQEIKSVIDAVNAVIRTETLALANQKGIESPAIPQYTIGELFHRYSYRCRRLGPKWYRHDFTLKAAVTR